MADEPDLTRQMASLWLNPETPTNADPFEAEETQHPWEGGLPPWQIVPGPLLRTWDEKSGSQPTGDNRIMARAPDMRLSDRETRRATLANHLNHRIWIDGPYVSFTSSVTNLERLARTRARNKYRGPQTITAINPNIRTRNGLPILNVETEMGHYNIPDPYDGHIGTYGDHYVCLWQVTEAEIIGHWQWSELEGDPEWYQNVVLPAYNESEDAAQPTAGQAPDAADPSDELSEFFQNLFSRSVAPEVAAIDANGQS